MPHVWVPNPSLRGRRHASAAELAGPAVGQLCDLAPAARAADSLQPGGSAAASRAGRGPGAGLPGIFSFRSLSACIRLLGGGLARDRRLVLHLRAPWNPAIFNVAPHDPPPKGFHGKGFEPPAE